MPLAQKAPPSSLAFQYIWRWGMLYEQVKIMQGNRGQSGEQENTNNFIQLGKHSWLI